MNGEPASCLCGCRVQLPPWREFFATNECVHRWALRFGTPKPPAAPLILDCGRLDTFNRCECGTRPDFPCPRERRRIPSDCRTA